MKALIFNSGLGKRLGDLTSNSPKCMIKLYNGETILERQIRILSECGIKDFVITTGPFGNMIQDALKQPCFDKLSFTFVRNEHYNSTNYIYSFYLARDFINDDFLILHGDLVFEKGLIKKILRDKHSSLALINKKAIKPEKDFKARVIDGQIREVGLDLFDDDCYTFQPLYKLTRKSVNIWLDSIKNFIDNKNILNVYAENALNVISSDLDIFALDYNKYFINEIDNKDDYKFVSSTIRMMDFKHQEITYSFNTFKYYLKQNKLRRPLVVADSFLLNSEFIKQIDVLLECTYFHDFKANPLYEDCIAGTKIFRENKCDSIIAIGGGSCIDTAKAIKTFLNMDLGCDCFEQAIKYNSCKLIVLPTTAGTGSESTRFAAIYKDGFKKSLTNDNLLPNFIYFNVNFLNSLPLKQKKATIFDALSQCIESIFSINKTRDSIRYSSKGIKLILKYIDNYLDHNDSNVYKFIYKAANFSGKAINISQTTAAHAMSYRLTSLFDIPHGQAVALTLPYLWRLLYSDAKYVKEFSLLNKLFHSNEPYIYFEDLLTKYNFKKTVDLNKDILADLANSINYERLSNFPLNLSKEDIIKIYQLSLNNTDN